MKLFKRKIKRCVIFAEYNDGIMTLKYNDNTEEQYKGSSTVWFKLPYMIRQGTMMEYYLHQIFEYIQYWNGTFPNAHLNNQQPAGDIANQVENGAGLNLINEN
ncbi:hypothetical protein [Massilibacteroides sp.]|uniref:hypothetical protein n=1 Tax=Massilibacteroides sp. TaxID=2034766 RepID=UPI0026170535|nr:hypothetical protein [Massilibacteroides sp.]MDD4515623.1 hypothetical protein [Massilibacteroides sp.]